MALFSRGSNPIGSMFTGGGMTPGQTIGRAYADFGKTIGGVGTSVKDVLTKQAEEREQQRLSEESRAILDQYAGNPTGLLARGQEMITSSEPAQAKMGERFITVANARIAQGQTEKEQRLGVFKTQVTAAARAGIPRNDPKVIALRTQIQQLDPTGEAFEDAYLKGSPKREITTLSAGERAIEVTTGTEGSTSKVIEDAVQAPQDLIYETEVDEQGVITVLEIDPNTKQSRVVSTHETRESALKEKQRLEAEINRLTKARRTRNTVNETIALIENNLANVDRGFFDSVGGLSQLLRFLPGTEQMNLEDLVSSIKANVGFDQLLSIKAAGSTLGQVSNIENALLQSTIANLNTFKKPEDILNALKKVRGYYNSLIVKGRLIEQHGKGNVPTLTWLENTNWTDANFVDAWREDFGGEVMQNPDQSYMVTMPEDADGNKKFYRVVPR
jgi:hypothetical protein